LDVAIKNHDEILIDFIIYNAMFIWTRDLQVGLFIKSTSNSIIKSKNHDWNNNFLVALKKTTTKNSSKKLSMIQRSDQNNILFWFDTTKSFFVPKHVLLTYKCIC